MTVVRLVAVCLVVIGVVLGMSGHAIAHEFDPHIAQLSERGKGEYMLRWQAPVTTTARLVLPDPCSSTKVREHDSTRWFTVQCGAAGLEGATLEVRGLPSPNDHVLLELRTLGGRHWQHLLRGEAARVVVPLGAISSTGAQVARSYFRLGIEHLLFGADHLLFVLGLLGLVLGPRRLIATATAFTAGHALTLCAASVGALRLSPAPVEACIALSLVWLARELALPNPSSLSRRAPWLAAGGFGLLHGLGFAGALAEFGLPAGQAPLALGAFNVGIEVAQIGAIGFALSLAHLTRKWPGRETLLRFAPLGMGAISMAWLYARVLNLVLA